MLEFEADTGKGVIVFAFALALVFFIVFTTSPMAALLGAALAGIVLIVAYYIGVRFDTWARGGR